MMPSTLDVKILVILAMVAFRPGEVMAQSKGDTVKIDTIRNKYLPTGIRIGTDVIDLIKTRTQENFSGWEINGDIDFNRYYLALEYGTWGRNFSSLTSVYANTGNYWRAGIDVNFLTKDPDRNLFFIGARYGRSVFTESMSVTLEDPNWGSLSDSFYQSDVNAWWIELTSGLKVKVWKIFWIGYTGRFKFALTTDATEEMLPFDVPGFGRTDKETTWGFNYYLMIRIPIRKTPPPPVEK